jgi:hypothetical protein
MVGRSGGAAGVSPVLVDPLPDLSRVEADEVTPLQEGDAPLGHEPTDVAGVHAQVLGQGRDVEQPRRQPVALVSDRL